VTVVHLDPEGHAKVQALLPWFVTGRLDATERAEVEAHLAGCPRCRAELALERQLHATQSVPEPGGDVDRGWASMRRRIDAGALAARRSVGTAGRPAGPGPSAGWRWALAAQFAMIVLLAAALLLPRLDGERYRGLGAAVAPANAVVMFSPDATEAQMRAALRESDARLVGGPTVAHAYLLALPVADDATLARLREQPGVTLAEALRAGAAP